MLHSLTLSEVTEHTFQSVDLVLQRLVDKIHLEASADDLDRLQTHDFHIVLDDQIFGTTQIDALGVLDAEGKRVNNSRDWPNTGINLSYREYFKALKNNRKINSYVSAPLQNSITGTWVIVLARSILTTEGKFLGVVFGSMTLNYFSDFFRSTSLGSDYAATLMRDDGTLLARYPQAGQIGQTVPVSVLKTLGNSRSGVSRSVSPLDQQERIAAAYRLIGYPLIVIVTRNEEAAFAAWRQIATIMLIAGVCMIVIVGLASFGMVAWWRQQERLRQSEAQRQFDVEAAEIGSWHYDFITGEISWSDRLRVIIGVPSATVATREIFLSRIYPPDVTIVEKNEWACRNGLRQYSTEYRVLDYDNLPRWVNSRGRTEFDDEGCPVRMHGAVQDITVRKQAEHERDELRRRLLHAQERERLRLAQELHDEAGQSIAAVLMQLRGMNELVNETGRDLLRSISKQLDQMGKALHRVAWELRPPSIAELGLNATLANYIGEWGERVGIEADYYCRDEALKGLAEATQTIIYRIVQEALTNIVKHARGVTAASVVIEKTAALLRITIEDNGAGLEANFPNQSGGMESGSGLGLAGIRERLFLLGGELSLEPRGGGGTTMFIRIPLERERSTG